MIQLVYTREAVNDLKRLRAFIATHNPNSAEKIAAELIKRIKLLQQMPMMGNPVTQAPDPEVIRDMVFGAYVVRYAVHGQTLAILRVWHHYESRA
jgi:plasmid stabilization system protein ParE